VTLAELVQGNDLFTFVHYLKSLGIIAVTFDGSCLRYVQRVFMKGKSIRSIQICHRRLLILVFQDVDGAVIHVGDHDLVTWAPSNMNRGPEKPEKYSSTVNPGGTCN
jgi:hypothetical protein